MESSAAPNLEPTTADRSNLPRPGGLDRPRTPTPARPLRTIPVPEDLLLDSGMQRVLRIDLDTNPRVRVPELDGRSEPPATARSRAADRSDPVPHLVATAPTRPGSSSKFPWVAGAVAGGAIVVAVALAVVPGDPTPPAPVVAASLTVDVVPGDASVEVDGKPALGVAPFIVDLAPGRHRVAVERAGFVPFAREVSVNGATPIVLPIRMESRDVRLQVVTAPGATIELLIDGEPSQSADPGGELIVRRVGDRQFGVRVSAPGFHAATVPVAFSGQPTQVLQLPLTPRPAVDGETLTDVSSPPAAP